MSKFSVLLCLLFVFASVAAFAQEGRKVDIIVTGDFPKDEPINPETLELNERDIRENVFVPGKYTLTIAQPGFHPHSEEITIPPGDGIFEIKRELVTARRVIVEKITFDVPPSPQLAPHTIVLQPFDSDEQIQVRPGDKIKPGSYHFRLEKPGYESIVLRKHIWPDVLPVLFEEEMIAREVAIEFDVQYDHKPENISQLQVYLVAQKTILCPVSVGSKIKPGKYRLQVVLSGYQCSIKEIVIAPSLVPYSLIIPLETTTETPSTQARNLSFDMVCEGRLVMAREILADGQQLSFKDSFPVGKEVELEIRFAKYKTVKQRVRITPGQGPQVLNVPLTQLKRYDFNSRVPLSKIAIDGQQVETHHVQSEKGVGRYYYTIWADPNAKDIQVFQGDKMTERPLDRVHIGLGSFTKSVGADKKLPPSPNAAETIAPLHDTEGYDYTPETPFKTAIDNPLSTFSVDVDTASYTNARRFIRLGQLPPKDAVRAEEFINYFRYDYPQPKEHPFSVTTELASCPWNHKNYLLQIGLQGRSIEQKSLPQSNLVFLIDVSGSMSDANKLPLVKSSLTLLVKNLASHDNVAIVTYANTAELVLASTSAANRTKITAAIEQLHAHGSTNGTAGIQMAYREARQNFRKDGNNRVILFTDGDFNIGASSDGELVRLIEKERESGIFLSVLGFGTGNLKDSKMEKIADHGNGNYAYIDSLKEGYKVLAAERGGTLVTIAKDVKVQIEFNPRYVHSYRLIGYENRRLAKEDFQDDKKDAGEIGAGHSVTALYEIVPGDSKSTAQPLRYQDKQLLDTADSGELLLLKLRYKKPDGNTSTLVEFPILKKLAEETSDNFRWASAVAGFAMLLRDSVHKGDLSYEQVLEMSIKSRGEDRDGYRQECIDLMKLAKEIGK